MSNMRPNKIEFDTCNKIGPRIKYVYFGVNRIRYSYSRYICYSSEIPLKNSIEIGQDLDIATILNIIQF